MAQIMRFLLFLTFTCLTSRLASTDAQNTATLQTTMQTTVVTTMANTSTEVTNTTEATTAATTAATTVATTEALTTAPPEHTTSKPTTRTVTTTRPAMTTKPTQPTQSPVWPPKAQWSVFDDEGGICMMMEFSSRLYIAYQNTSNDYTYTTVDVPTTAVAASSSCVDNGPRYFVLHLYNQASYWYLNFTFNLDSKYSLTEVGLAWTVEGDIFPNPKDENTRTYQYTVNENFLNNSVPLGRSFTCGNGLIFKTQLATIVLEELTLQPFADHANGDFGENMECRNSDGSSNTGLIIGISVGAGLLVVFALAAVVFAIRKHKSGSEDLDPIINS